MSKKTILKVSKEVKVAQKNHPEQKTHNHSLVSFSADKPAFTQDQIDKFLTIALCLGLILGLLLLGYKIIPQNIYPSTNYAKAEKEKQEEIKNAAILEEKKKEFEANKEKETAYISDKNKATIKTNFGDINIQLSPLVANTSDNFKRLTYRNIFENNKFHRIVKKSAEGFYVIQGGDKGKGASAALNATLNDEVWKVAPTFDAEGKLTNAPEFFDSSLYRDFKALGLYQGTQVNEVIYPKGTIAMAKTSLPNSATTQFFITLQDTKLEPNYTAFGKITNLEILDKIFNEVGVKPVDGMPVSDDGEPDKEIKIEKVELSQ